MLLEASQKLLVTEGHQFIYLLLTSGPIIVHVCCGAWPN